MPCTSRTSAHRAARRSHGIRRANIFIRYLTQDNIDLSEKARKIFEDLKQGTISATTCEGVLVEVVQVLSSKRLYNLPRAEIQDKLSILISLRGLRIANKSVYIQALHLYAASPYLDFVDALQVVHMRRAGITSMISFDQDFDRVSGITRRES